MYVNRANNEISNDVFNALSPKMKSKYSKVQTKVAETKTAEKIVPAKKVEATKEETK